MNLKTEKVKKEWTEDYLSKLRKRLNCSHERKQVNTCLLK